MKYEEYTPYQAIKKYPMLKELLPASVVIDPNYIVRIGKNEDGSITFEFGYPEDEFLIAS